MYQKASLVIVNFETEDIITTSNTNPNVVGDFGDGEDL